MEIWKSIPGHTHYMASSLGRIKSVQRTQEICNRWGSTTLRVLEGRILKPYRAKNGYTYTSLGTEARRETYYWIALTFLGPKKDNQEVNHINFDRSDNRASNLEWTTRSENRQHSIINGRHNKVKLSSAQVIEIRELLKTEIRKKDICDKYKVDRHTIQNIARRKTWSYV